VRLAVTCSPFSLGKNSTWGALIAAEEQAVTAGASSTSPA
jgi:hypothetical protein